MHGHDLGLSVAENYRAFAQDDRGRSPMYESLAGSVAQDTAVLCFLGSLPPEKRQPNLLFAAARYLLGGPADLDRLRALVSQNRAELAGVMLTRRTQTNEPARCATLLPALAQLPPPLALIEVGASAGLTLLFDRYSYDYAGHRIAGTDCLAPTCAASRADRCPCRHGFPRSPGGPGWTSTRSTSPATTTCAGCRAWCGPVKASASSGSPPRSPQPAATLPWSIAVTCSPTCPH
jgi:uncharacterized protein DUF2332